MKNIYKKENVIKKEKDKIEEFDEPLEQPGKIFLAEIHGSAQRLLKIRKLSKYIRFCKCCLLPSETTGVVIPYSCLDNKKDFGLGIYLYFHYIRFCILITFISLCISSIPTMVFSIRYSNDINEYCKLYYVDSDIIKNNNNQNTNYNNSHINMTNNNITSININNTNKTNDKNMNNDTNDDLKYKYITDNENCLKFLSMKENNKTTIDLDSIISIDWIFKMSSDNIKIYYDLFKNEHNIIDSILIDYSFLYFLTGIILLIINFFYVHYFNLLDEADNFEDITPSDFTILVHGVKRPKNNNNMTRKDYLMTLINEISQNYFTLEVHQIIPCYNLVELYKLTKQVFEDRTKIYHAYNFKKQKDLKKKYKSWHEKNENFSAPKNNTEINNFNISSSASYVKINSLARNSSQNAMLFNNNNNTFNQQDYLNYYTRYCCYIKATPLKEIQERINKNNEKIKEIEKDITENPNKYNCGTYFVVFKYIKMRDKIYAFFPTNVFSKMIIRIKYFFQNILFSKCVEEKTKRSNFIKLSFTLEHATEAYEVLWKNLGYTQKEKYLYLFISIVVSLFLVALSLCIVLLLNHIQYNLTNNDSDNIWKYILSFLISICIAITNALGRETLKKVTSEFETIETKTGYYISLSAKLTFFTFINTAIVPLLSNYIRKNWGNNEILLNNVLMIFITNVTFTPFLFYVGPGLCLKLSRRAKARLDLEGIKWEDSPYTQGELNKIFENPKMDLCYKYSFLVNILLTSLFYMSIFPLGTVFGLVALVFSYFLETYYLGYYKRPEVLNARLCKFFIYNFKIVISVFFIGNYIFFSSINQYKSFWCIFNFIFFIAIAFIPYHSYKINLLGTTEGEAKKGSYEDYELMFPTDYEKQNPLTKKKAMIKYFKKLELMKLIDKYQSDYLIKNANKESIMDNYYKTSKNPENILNSYEFQRQFLKLKKKYKYIRKIRQRKILLSHDENFEDKDSINNSEANMNRNTIKTINTINEVPLKDLESNLEKKIEYPTKYDVNTLIQHNQAKKNRASVYMRKTLFQQIKNEGIYDESEEEKEDDSFESDINSNNILLNKKENFNFSLASNESREVINKNEVNNNNKKFRNESDLYDKKSDYSLYSIKTNFKDKQKNNNNNSKLHGNYIENVDKNKHLKKDNFIPNTYI